VKVFRRSRTYRIVAYWCPLCRTVYTSPRRQATWPLCLGSAAAGRHHMTVTSRMDYWS
jgi:hypothetical protein